MASRPPALCLKRLLRSRKPCVSAPVTQRCWITSPVNLAQAKSIHVPGFKAATEEELRDVRDSVRAFTKQEIPETLAHQVDQTNEFPSDMWKKLGDAGLLGVTADTKYGGLGLGYQAHSIAMEELSRASGSIGLSYAAHSQLCINQLTINGSDEQKERFLPGLISGEKVGALAMSEASAGSDVLGMKMSARKKENGYVLNGTKMWITNGPDVDYLIVYAVTESTGEPARPSRRLLTTFIVEKTFKGFSCSRKLDKLGMRGSNTGELVFDNVFVPNENILGKVDGGTTVLMSGLDLERLVLSAGPVGIMQACIDVVLPYTRSRKQFQQPIGGQQLVQGKLADMFTKLNASRALTQSVARLIDRTGCAAREDCAGAILFAAERATECALDTIQLLGGMGYVNEMPAGRLLRDAKLYEIGAGTSEIRRIVIGRALHKRDPSISV